MTQNFLSDFTAAAGDSLQRLSWLLERNKGSIVVILDDEQKYLGVVNRQRLCSWLELEGRDGEGPCAADMTSREKLKPLHFCKYLV